MEDIASLWSSASIVFDANVLLDFHRYEPQTSETYLSLASAFKTRLWAPFQAVQEYHENRAGVRSAATSVHDDQIGLINKLITNLTQAPRKSQLTAGEKHGALLSAAKDLLTELQSTRESVAERNAPDADDPILDRLSELFSDGQIGPKPTDDELKRLHKTGSDRFANKVPPGYMDAGKKPGNRQFGDFILWQQVMTYARDEKRDILLVTEDAKEDWWVSVHGKQIMPRPELVNEFREFTGGRSIHFYNGLSFFDHAAREVGNTSTPEAIEAARKDLEEVAQSRAEELAESTLDELFADIRKPGRPDPLRGPTTLGQMNEAARLETIYSDSVDDLRTQIEALEASLFRTQRHMQAREEAGTETDDPVTQGLLRDLRWIRQELHVHYKKAGLNSYQVRARELLLLGESEHVEF